MKVEFKHILCATDLTELSNLGARQAKVMAEEYGARLSLCHVIDTPTVALHGTAYVFQDEEIMEAEKKHALELLMVLAESWTIQWEPIVVSGPVAKTISDLVKEKGVDLAIVTTHGRKGLRRLFLGSVTEQLLRTVACPLLIVGDHGRDRVIQQEKKEFRFEKIVVGCDFSKDSSLAVDYAFSLAQEFQAEIHLVHVIEAFIYRDAMLSDYLRVDAVDGQTELCRERLSAIVPEEAENWCKVKCVCIDGKPFEELTRYANQIRADLMVMGVRGHGLVETLLLGSTTDRVIRRVACPVMSVCQAQ